MTARTAARLAAVLLVVTAGLFVVGVTEENGDQHTDPTEATQTEGEAAHEGESGETAEQHADEAESEASDFTENRKILRLDPESPGLVAVGVVVSAALAAGLWLTNKRRIALAAAAFATLFAALDATEVSHQLDENRNSLVALAVAIAVGHAVAALAAGRATLRPDTTQGVGVV
jgi:hypothetical protein